jgi:hypothetical protein
MDKKVALLGWSLPAIESMQKMETAVCGRKFS